jgi:hypothetical protein
VRWRRLAFVADHPALIDPTEASPITVGGHAGARIETALSTEVFLGGQPSFEPIDPAPIPGGRYRLDLIRVADEIVLYSTFLYPDGVEDATAFADQLIAGIYWAGMD